MSGSGPRLPVEVAVAVIEAPKRRVLLAQRPIGKPMAGYWEFPGGKLEPGESVFRALQREIDEELGISVDHADPWVVLPFRYPHATVRLHFMRVRAWHGTPRSRERQAFRFEPIDAWSLEPWLPGARPLKRWLHLPPRYAISDAAGLGAEVFLQRFEARAQADRGFWLLLREPDLSETAFRALFRRSVLLARRYGVRLLVSSRHASSYWYEADGVHLTQRDLWAAGTRPPVAWCLASCHAPSDLERAAALQCDAAMLGQVFETASHPRRPGCGWPGFMHQVAATPLPVYALGGLSFTAQSLVAAQSAGATGIAAQRAAW